MKKLVLKDEFLEVLSSDEITLIRLITEAMMYDKSLGQFDEVFIPDWLLIKHTGWDAMRFINTRKLLKRKKLFRWYYAGLTDDNFYMPNAMYWHKTKEQAEKYNIVDTENLTIS